MSSQYLSAIAQFNLFLVDSTVMFAETGLNEFGCVFKDDDDDTQGWL